jgi:hypothetical protein
MINSTQIKSLLDKVETLVKHQRDIDLLKGENFNIFSVLKMESKENATHSAFLGELLNPKGSHLLGSSLLKLFLDQFGLTDHINLPTAEVKLEKSIGARNDTDKKGGRVDIYVWDNRGQTICIENKIYAHDQHAQIERYVNHNNKNKIVDGETIKTNKVYYLTLNRSEPSENSKGKLLEGKDYVNISYKDDITKWLKSCVKEAAEIPILRETIKQYIILIKKLTNTMSDEKQEELISTILENADAAEFIVTHFVAAKEKIGNAIRNSVFKKLELELGNRYSITIGANISSNFAQIWIKPAKHKGKGLQFGIESFSGKGHQGGKLFVGIFSNGLNVKEFVEVNNFSLNGWWINLKILSQFKGFDLILKESSLMKEIYINEDFKESLINHIVKECKTYIDENELVIKNYLVE